MAKHNTNPSDITADVLRGNMRRRYFHLMESDLGGEQYQPELDSLEEFCSDEIISDDDHDSNYLSFSDAGTYFVMEPDVGEKGRRANGRRAALSDPPAAAVAPQLLTGGLPSTNRGSSKYRDAHECL